MTIDPEREPEPSADPPAPEAETRSEPEHPTALESESEPEAEFEFESESGSGDGAAAGLESAAPAIEPAPEPEPKPRRPAPIAMIPNQGRRPEFGEEVARASWRALTALWHPALLLHFEAIPVCEPIESPSEPRAEELRLYPENCASRLPSGYLTNAQDIGARCVEAAGGRLDVAADLRGRLGIPPDPERSGSDVEALEDVVRDFHALGAAHWWLRELTIAMGHAETLDADAFARETLRGARAWRDGDRSAALGRLRAAFELLTQARERYYPMDCHLYDLCLLDRASDPAPLGALLERRAPLTLLAQADAVEALAAREPGLVRRIADGVSAGWLDVAGGVVHESEEPLAPLGSVLWQYRRAVEIYRATLDERTVETFARRRFGLHAMIPQIANRFGFRFALHFCLDDGAFPTRSEGKLLWDGPDGSSLESIIRLPIPANSAVEGFKIPWILAESMRYDSSALIGLVHWPEPTELWYRDARRIAEHSPVLTRWLTLNDAFHYTDRPYESFHPGWDDYQTPYLTQAVQRGDARPISARAGHARLRARFDALASLAAATRALECAANPPAADEPEPTSPLAELENRLEAAAPGSRYTLETEIRAEEQRIGERFARLLTAHPPGSARGSGNGNAGSVPSEPNAEADSGTETEPKSETGPDADSGTETESGAGAGAEDGARPGYLVPNFLPFPREVPVELPDGPLDLRPEGPLKGSQLIDTGVHAAVSVPAMGYAWLPAESNPDRPPAPFGILRFRDMTLGNGIVEAEIDGGTGGLRSVRLFGEPSPRLAQQLVAVRRSDSEEGAELLQSRMTRVSHDVDYAGPVLAQAHAIGELVDPGSPGAPIATFRQTYRLWIDRPILEIEIALTHIDPDWKRAMAESPPWRTHIACRWAWADATADTSFNRFLGIHPTASPRPETPEAFHIDTRGRRVSLLFGGLAHHRRHGARMLDTLLVAGAEEERLFRLGVAFDSESPHRPATDFVAPAVAIPAPGPPRRGPSGWLFHIDSTSVAVARIEFVRESSGSAGSDGGGAGWGLAFTLAETSGHARRCRLRLFRDPIRARQTDFQGVPHADLPVDGDAVLVDLTPHEIARIEVALG